MNLAFGTIILLMVLLTLITIRRLQVKAAALSLFLLLFSSQSALAAPPIIPGPIAAQGAFDSAVTQQQKQLGERLKTNPDGNHYNGIEYSNKSVQRQPDDQTILDKIESKVPDSVVSTVSNGSVRLSGRVQDRESAQEIVKQVKNIPGVHEVAFDLGLDIMAQLDS